MERTHDNSVSPHLEGAEVIPDVTIYVDPQCAHCRKLREFLQRKQVPFYEHDVTRDLSAQEFLTSRDVDGVPVTRVGDEIVVGFDEERLNELIRSSETASANA